MSAEKPMSKIVLENGIELDPTGGWAKNATEYAAQKKLDRVVVYWVTDTNGSNSYLLTQDGNPLKEDTSFEGVAAYIDMMALARK